MWHWLLVPLLMLPVQAGAQIADQRPAPRPQVETLPPDVIAAPVPILRPIARPETLVPLANVQPLASVQADASIRRLSALRPQPRPATLVPPATVQPLTTTQPDASIRRLSVLRPRPRPQERAAPGADGQLELAAAPPAPVKPERNKKERTSRKGSVCGDASIKGEEIARITSKVKGCGIAEPVRITSVSGVRLSQAATLDCDTAVALNRWVQTGLQPAFGRNKVVELQVAAHYICRSRNNVKGARISEHGRGKAIDISAITLESGKTVSVLGGFGKELRRAHKAACGTFGTTLGPGSDGFHEDHMHFDTASHRSGPYCR